MSQELAGRDAPDATIMCGSEEVNGWPRFEVNHVALPRNVTCYSCQHWEVQRLRRDVQIPGFSRKRALGFLSHMAAPGCHRLAVSPEMGPVPGSLLSPGTPRPASSSAAGDKEPTHGPAAHKGAFGGGGGRPVGHHCPWLGSRGCRGWLLVHSAPRRNRRLLSALTCAVGRLEGQPLRAARCLNTSRL